MIQNIIIFASTRKQRYSFFFECKRQISDFAVQTLWMDKLLTPLAKVEVSKNVSLNVRKNPYPFHPNQ